MAERRRNEKIERRPKFIADSETRDAALSLDDARLAIACTYDFLDWPSLAAYVEAVAQQGGGSAHLQIAECLRSLGATK